MSYIFLDIGGTKTRIGVSFDGKRLGKIMVIPTPRDAGAGVKILRKAADELSGGKKVKAVVAGIAGSLDRRRSVIVGGGANIKGWMGADLKKKFENAFRARVFLENDASLAGLAEAVRGAGKGREIVVYYTVSTGFGGARITRGSIDPSSRGFEPAYQIIRDTAMSGSHGGRIGGYLSGRAIEKNFGKKAELISDPKIKDGLARLLAVAINNGIVHWSPDIFVVGGSVMNIITLARVRYHLKKIYQGVLPPPPIKKAALGDLVGLHGALEYLKRQSGKKS